MVKGVSSGFEKNLEISGVGYRAEVASKTLKLVIGFSAPVEYAIPEGIQIKVDKQVNIAVSGIDKQLVGRVAAEIRSLKKPEPYKGKGIKYAGEAGQTQGRQIGRGLSFRASSVLRTGAPREEVGHWQRRELKRSG